MNNISYALFTIGFFFVLRIIFPPFWVSKDELKNMAHILNKDITNKQFFIVILNILLASLLITLSIII